MPEDNEDDDGMESDHSDTKSKMSFSYWGADKVTVQKPIIKGRVVPVARRGGGPTSYGRESSANAKFGTRLISNDTPATGVRPGSRRTQAVVPSTRKTPTPSTAPPPQDDSAKGKPGWNSNTRAPVVSAAKRVRNISQTSAAATSTRTPVASKILSSPAPSQDSGVRLRVVGICLLLIGFP